MRKAGEITVRRYEPDSKHRWDEFVDNAKNGHFMFMRDYMDYHGDRFADHSLMFEQKGKLIALLPANEKESELISHEGLTFGGILSSQRTGVILMSEVVAELRAYTSSKGFSRIVYKAIPYIYAALPSEEDLYALFSQGGRLFRRDISTAIRLSSRIAYSKGRKENIKKAQRAGIVCTEAADLSEFWLLLNEVLVERHGVKAIHTREEMELLHKRFPKNIRLCEARDADGTLLAGALLYINRGVVHAQYLANSTAGREVGALDAAIEFAIGLVPDARYFDFGISTTDAGMSLNRGLQAQKEGFGGRGVVHDFYELQLA